MIEKVKLESFRKRYNIGIMLGLRYKPGIAYSKSVVFWVLAISLLALPTHAQKGGGAAPPGGSGGGSRGTTGGAGPPRAVPPPIMPGSGPEMEPGVIIPATMQPLPKPTVPEDESCLPWDLPNVRGATVSAVSLGVPGKARSQYEKACSAFKKLKMPEAEQHARDAIQKYSNYSAAWVMLGQALQGENKMDEAHEACSQPIHADPTYLPPYLCLAGLLNVEKKWSDLLTWSDRFLGININGDLYANYYRGLAQFHLHDFPEAQKSILKAIAIDTDHHQPGLNFLMAQIYGQQGDVVEATVQVQQFVKFSKNRQDQDSAREYLSELQQAKPSAK
jgi:tetratricopeptide (TPR) repeat protein